LIRLKDDPAWGISMIDFVILSVESEPPPGWVVEMGYKDVTDVPNGYKGGFSINVPAMEVPIYLPRLRRCFEDAGGKMAPIRRLVQLEEVPGCYDLIVNCSGLGAKELCGDELVYPNRAQVARIDNPGLKRGMACLEPLMYIIPRPRWGDCVLGGTSENGNSDTQASDSDRSKILAACRAAEPMLKNWDPILDVVGLRPCRRKPVPPVEGSEPEEEICLNRGVLLDGRPVVHNYGHGGAGFTLSWGCAREVRRYVEEAVASLTCGKITD
jgi:D-amino-acid oxidase